MARRSTSDPERQPDHQSWIHSRILLNREFFDAWREGAAMIAAGFGSFAIFEGLASVAGHDALPRAFALAITALGVVVVSLASWHHRKMKAWVDIDEYGSLPAPELPDERLADIAAGATILVGAVSFGAVLLLR